MAGSAEYVGRQLGNYRLLRLLGEGGFALVYLGEHIHLGTYAAVKLLLTQLVSDDVEQFRHEAQTIARLLHPNIVRVLDFGIEGNAPYLVMDYAPNGTLRGRHPKMMRVPLATVVGYTLQVAEALQYAHDQRLIHRDIKPENMLLGRNQEVLLSDFGIALTSQSTSSQRTQDIAGTVAYMAPEQLQAHPRPASDQYSLGVVVYEWLCGSRPFQGTYTEIAVKHALAAPPALRSWNPDLPSAVEEVVMVALQKDPRQRFPSVRAFAQALEQVSRQSPLAHAPQDLSTHIVASSAPASPLASMPLAQGPLLSVPPPSLVPPPGVPSGVPYGSIQASPPFQGAAMMAHPDVASASNLSTSSSPFSMTPVSPPDASRAMTMDSSTMDSSTMNSSIYTAGPIATPGSPLRPSPRRLSRRVLVVGALGLIAGSSVVTWKIVQPTGTASPTLPVSNPLTNPYASLSPTAPPAGPILTYSAQQDYTWAVDWSPNGKYIVSGSFDGTAHVWNADSGQRVLSYRSATKPAVSDNAAVAVAWSPNSAHVAVGFKDGTAQVVDVASGEQVATYGSVPWPGRLRIGLVTGRKISCAQWN